MFGQLPGTTSAAFAISMSTMMVSSVAVQPTRRARSALAREHGRAAGSSTADPIHDMTSPVAGALKRVRRHLQGTFPGAGSVPSHREAQSAECATAPAPPSSAVVTTSARSRFSASVPARKRSTRRAISLAASRNAFCLRGSAACGAPPTRNPGTRHRRAPPPRPAAAPPHYRGPETSPPWSRPDTARRRHGPHDRLLIAVSNQAHSSTGNALRIIGVEPLMVPTADHRLTGSALRAALLTDAGPAGVIAVAAGAGTTNAEIIDDLERNSLRGPGVRPAVPQRGRVRRRRSPRPERAEPTGRRQESPPSRRRGSQRLALVVTASQHGTHDV